MNLAMSPGLMAILLGGLIVFIPLFAMIILFIGKRMQAQKLSGGFDVEARASRKKKKQRVVKNKKSIVSQTEMDETSGFLPITPAPQQVTPAPQQVTPAPQQVTPAPQQVTPAPQQVTPAPQQVTPTNNGGPFAAEITGDEW